MSNIYVLEPVTKGKVVFETTVGDIEIELWPKEAPKACRNFVQLCLEGYYDNTIFHRIIKGFLVQGGDPTGTGEGGVSIYGEPFPTEVHSRLRFNHRGIVAMAGENDDNGSQFFITLDKTEWLNGKHTIFGKVVGDTIFNVLKMADLEVDENDRPVYPPKIRKAEVIVNPFDDIVPRDTFRKKPEEEKEKKPKKKGTKNMSLLSFGEEAAAEATPTSKAKIKSSHDVLNDPKLRKETAVDPEAIAQREAESQAAENKIDKVKESVRQALSKSKTEDSATDAGGKNFAAKMRENILSKKRKLQGAGAEAERAAATTAAGAAEQEDSTDVQDNDNEVRSQTIDDIRQKEREERSQEYENLRREVLKLKKKKSKKQEEEEKKDQPLSYLEQQRLKYKNKKAKTKHREEDTAKRLEAFNQKLAESLLKGATAAPTAAAAAAATTTTTEEEEKKPKIDQGEGEGSPAEGETEEDKAAVRDVTSFLSHQLRVEKSADAEKFEKIREELANLDYYDPLTHTKLKAPSSSSSSRDDSHHHRHHHHHHDRDSRGGRYSSSSRGRRDDDDRDSDRNRGSRYHEKDSRSDRSSRDHHDRRRDRDYDYDDSSRGGRRDRDDDRYRSTSSSRR